MATYRARGRCSDCGQPIRVVAGKSAPHGDCPAAGSSRVTSVRWQAIVKRDGRSWTRTGATKAAVAKWVEKTERDLDAGIQPGRGNDLPTVGEWERRWWAARLVEPTTATSDRSRLDVHVLPRWRDVPLDRILRIDVKAWIKDLQAAGLAADTVRRVVGLLSSMIEAAVDEELIGRNVCHKIELPTVANTREVFLTVDQALALADAMAEPHRTLTIVLAWTGIRWGEAQGLRVCDLQMLRRPPRLHVRRPWTRHGPKEYPKGKQNRFVPLADIAYEALAAHLARDPASGSELVFRTPQGAPLPYRTYWGNVFATAVAKAGLGEVGLRPHDLRHTCASWLVQAGVPLYDVGAWLGHRDEQTTRRYAHLAPEHGDRGWAALNEAQAR